MFVFEETGIDGLILAKPRIFADDRGAFVKTFHEGMFRERGINFTLREEFFSVSRKDVIRGMHFQTPPSAHGKVVYCVAGRVLDVVLDIRRKSPTYGEFRSFDLSDENRLILFIPVGMAHGFRALTDGACMVYKTDAVYDAAHDCGILWNSFGFDWGAANPVVSKRDAAFPTLAQYESPF
jgi:dTDP-4-dehydrorhamnose 3,5-epimerase